MPSKQWVTGSNPVGRAIFSNPVFFSGIRGFSCDQGFFRQKRAILKIEGQGKHDLVNKLDRGIITHGSACFLSIVIAVGLRNRENGGMWLKIFSLY